MSQIGVSGRAQAFVATGVAVAAVLTSCSGGTASPFGDDGGNASGDGALAEGSMMLGGDATLEGSISYEGGFHDGKPVLDGAGCLPDGASTTPLVQHVCVKYGADNNECDGHHDLAGFPPNGTGGNGFDDNCNGLVDEGCACPAPGQTKTCYLIPASMEINGMPLGWCAENSKGTVDCLQLSTEASPTWSGQCRGAQPPYPDDFCAPGDFNCDGVSYNSMSMDCSCKAGTVECPTAPLQTVPYPPVTMLPLQVDASSWFTNPQEVSQATNWKWTLTGGDCDNILPHPTFGLYASTSGAGSPLGNQANNLGLSGKEHGMVATAPGLTSSLYPAFSLSGDYVLVGEFDLNGQHYACTEKIQVRAPGLRAEACWDTEGSLIDLDLHMAKVDGFTPQCTGTLGWSDNCPNEDCFYGNCANASSTQISWFPASGNAACVGWGSEATGPCNNPRLDRDTNGISGKCDATITDPNTTTGGIGGGGFCGPENVNVDTPANGDQYAVAVRYYNGALASKTHVNVYCNGDRILSAGYNPVTSNDFPQLLTAGQDATGDMWKVALVQTAVSGNTISCTVNPVPSKNPHPMTDGSKAYCVDNANTDGSTSGILFTPSGGPPANAAALCFH